MKSPMPVTWKKCGIVAATLLVVIGFAAGWMIHSETTQSVALVRNETRIDAAGFIQASEAWINAESTEAWISVHARQSFQRAVDLILLGSAAYVQVVHGDAVIVDSVDETWASSIPLRISSTRYAEDSVIIDSYEGHLLADVIVPIGTPNQEGLSTATSYARVGYELNSLSDHLQMIRLAGTGIALASFLLACTGAAILLAWLDHQGLIISPCHRIVHSFTSASSVGPLVLDERAKQVTLHGRVLFLPPKPFQLLALLMRERGSVLKEEDIVGTLWPEVELADSRDVRQCVYLLRKRLDSVIAGAGACIANIKGFGYRYDPSPLEELTSESEPEAAAGS